MLPGRRTPPHTLRHMDQRATARFGVQEIQSPAGGWETESANIITPFQTSLTGNVPKPHEHRPPLKQRRERPL